MFFGKKDVLLERLGEEVKYLRMQNQQLLDRLLVMTDRNAFAEIKHQEGLRNRENIELAKYKGLSAEAIHEKLEQENKENEIVNIQLRQMMTGGDGSLNG